MHARRLLPERLKPGDTIGIASPAWGGAGLFPHRTERGLAYLQSLGFKVRVGEHALHQHGFVSDTPENRAADLHSLFADPEVKMILAAIGGDHSCHLLPLLDFDLIRANPKIFMGYSDITVLNVAIWQQTGLVTFNGPALLTDFAEHPRMLAYTEQNWLRVVTSGEPTGLLEPAPAWTEEFLDWSAQEESKRPRQMLHPPGWTWLKEGQAEGGLIGGCLTSLEHLRGTRFWPDWTDSVLFFETSEDKPGPDRVDAILMDYENMGVFDSLKGMLVGRPMKYSLAEKAELREVICERTKRWGFPILADMDFGHTAPQLTLPLGCRVRLDSRKPGIEILDPAVR